MAVVIVTRKESSLSIFNDEIESKLAPKQTATFDPINHICVANSSVRTTAKQIVKRNKNYD